MNLNMATNQKIGVLGGGSWATALMKILHENLDQVNWYLRDHSNIEYLKEYHHNKNYISSISFDTRKIQFYNDINAIVRESDVLIFVIPAAFLKEALRGLQEDLNDKIIVSAIKGIIPEDNTIVAEHFSNTFGLDLQRFVVISGPCHAEEVALERLSYLTVASQDQQLARDVARILRTHYMQTNVSEDIYGTEYAAILKNIFAIAAGICHGLGYGDNFLAVLISNGMQEIKRFVEAVHPISRDLHQSVYLGDLLVTAYSQFSRNRTFGNMIGKGYSVRSAQLEMNMIAEGYYASRSIMEINKAYQADMPICETIYHILYENISPAVEVKLLSNRLK